MDRSSILEHDDPVSLTPPMIHTGEPSHCSGGLRAYLAYRSEDVAPAPSLLSVPTSGRYDEHWTGHRRLSVSAPAWASSETQYVVAGREVPEAPDPWEEWDRLRDLVSAAWKSEKSAVELVIEGRQ